MQNEQKYPKSQKYCCDCTKSTCKHLRHLCTILIFLRRALQWSELVFISGSLTNYTMFAKHRVMMSKSIFLAEYSAFKYSIQMFIFKNNSAVISLNSYTTNCDGSARVGNFASAGRQGDAHVYSMIHLFGVRKPGTTVRTKFQHNRFACPTLISANMTDSDCVSRATL